MATQQVRQWGVTPPISMTLPLPEEVAANDDLIAELKAQNNFELPSDTERRKQSLQLMQRVTVEFIKVVSKRKGLSQAAVEASGGKIFTYGSYRLGVYGPGSFFFPCSAPLLFRALIITGSDIDTLVVAPKHVLIEDFFSDFPPILERMSPPGAIEKLTPVPDAFVPLIKLEFSGISFDLIFARLIIPSIPLNLDLKNNDYLRGLDDKEVRSLNGTRVTDQILELVPQEKTFRLALRAIKLWAQRTFCPPPLLRLIFSLIYSRSCHLRQHCRVSGRRCMGDAGRTCLSIVSSGDWVGHSWQVFSYHE